MMTRKSTTYWSMLAIVNVVVMLMVAVGEENAWTAFHTIVLTLTVFIAGYRHGASLESHESSEGDGREE